MNPYTALKSVHLACVVASITGFAWRFGLAVAGSPSLQSRFARTAPHVVDTLLLASAIGVAVLGGFAPWQDAWLAAKIIGLLVYIVAGSYAIRRARSRGGRWVAGLVAFGVYAYIVAVAFSKSPWIAS